MSKNLEICISADGIGPHFDNNRIQNNKFNTGGLTAAIYAENGTGKTFFSRMFALCENSVSAQDAERLLSIGKTSGEFTFEIKDSGITNHKYSVKIKENKIPDIIKTGKPYISCF